MVSYDERKKDIGNRIRTERESCGLKMKELLPKIYKSEQSYKTLAAWENGERLPDLDSLTRMAEVFDCDVGYLLCDYNERRRITADVCKATGLSEKAISRIIDYKEQYPDYIDSLNFLLESDNLEDALFCIYEYSNALLSVDALRTYRYEQIAALDTIRDYKPNLKLLDEIRQRQEKADLCEYNLSTRFSFIVQEIKRKVENEPNAARRGNNG